MIIYHGLFVGTKVALPLNAENKIDPSHGNHGFMIMSFEMTRHIRGYQNISGITPAIGKAIDFIRGKGNKKYHLQNFQAHIVHMDI